jgi:transcriptional regulator with XRE-family HTH domain
LNETLCRALLQARLTEEDVAARLQVDPKTVRRWLEGRVPYLQHRWALASLLGLDETDLWPHLRGAGSRPDEVQAIYPHLEAVSEDLWVCLFGSAEHEIGILADTAQPIAGYPRVRAVLAEKAAARVRVRICLPDPSGTIVPQHPTTQANDAQVREALFSLLPLREKGQVEIRLHRAIVYGAVYYADDELLVGQHVYGVPNAHVPVVHLRRAVAGDMASTYLRSFEDVWVGARSVG